MVQFITPLGGIVTAVEPPPAANGGLQLASFPNPFRASTTIRYTLARGAQVDLQVFDLNGRLVRNLERGEVRKAGTYSLRWDGSNERGQPVASGVYFYRLVAGGQVVHRKISVLR